MYVYIYIYMKISQSYTKEQELVYASNTAASDF